MLCLDDLADELDELEEKLDSDDFDIDDQTRIRQLRGLEKELDRSLRDAANEEPTLIPECEWEEYCRDMADSCGYLDGRGDNPLHNHIDWKSWADSVADDYMTVEFEGISHYYRNY